jgi:membrane-associated phospholipid phosphatase
VFLAEPVRRLIDALEPNKLDAFPSLHAAILLVTMVAARAESRRLFRAFLPVAVGITVSLVYLGYHWVVDVVAGFLWAPFAIWLSGLLARRLEGRCPPHFGATAP